MSIVLVVKEGPEVGRRFDLDRELVVGREAEGLTLDDAELSRRHAAFRPQGAAGEVEDLGSLNGTFVNGRRIDGVTRLSAGDTVKLGMTVFVVEAVRAAATMPSAPVPVAAGAAPLEPFGAYAVPAGRRHRGVASRQLLPLLLSWAVVAATAVALAIYFAHHR